MWKLSGGDEREGRFSHVLSVETPFSIPKESVADDVVFSDLKPPFLFFLLKSSPLLFCRRLARERPFAFVLPPPRFLWRQIGRGFDDVMPTSDESRCCCCC